MTDKPNAAEHTQRFLARQIFDLQAALTAAKQEIERMRPVCAAASAHVALWGSETRIGLIDAVAAFAEAAANHASPAKEEA